LISRTVRSLVPVLLLSVVALLGTLLVAVTVEAVPPQPFSPYGTVTVNGENVPEGTPIGAWCGGVQQQEAGSLLFEGDSVYYMDVPGYDKDNPSGGGCLAGEVVTFTITLGQDVLQADQEVVWTTGDGEVNLTAFQPWPVLDVEKWTNGQDADQPPGPFLEAGESVTWTYVVSNTGNVTLTQVAVVDDKEGEVVCPKTTLVAGDWMVCTALTGTAVSGRYANLVTASGLYESTVWGDRPASDSDWSHYYNSFVIYLPLVVRNS